MPSMVAGPWMLLAVASSSNSIGFSPPATFSISCRSRRRYCTIALSLCAEMLPGAVLDRAHRFHRPLVVDVDVAAHAGIGRGRLLVRIEAVIVGPVLARLVVRQLVELEPLLAHLLLVDRGSRSW